MPFSNPVIVMMFTKSRDRYQTPLAPIKTRIRPLRMKSTDFFRRQIRLSGFGARCLRNSLIMLMTAAHTAATTIAAITQLVAVSSQPSTAVLPVNHSSRLSRSSNAKTASTNVVSPSHDHLGPTRKYIAAITCFSICGLRQRPSNALWRKRVRLPASGEMSNSVDHWRIHSGVCWSSLRRPSSR